MGARAAPAASSKCSVKFEVALSYEHEDVEQARLRHELRAPGLREASLRQEPWRDNEAPNTLHGDGYVTNISRSGTCIVQEGTEAEHGCKQTM